VFLISSNRVCESLMTRDTLRADTEEASDICWGLIQDDPLSSGHNAMRPCPATSLSVTESCCLASVHTYLRGAPDLPSQSRFLSRTGLTSSLSCRVLDCYFRSRLMVGPVTVTSAILFVGYCVSCGSSVPLVDSRAESGAQFRACRTRAFFEIP